MKFYREFDDMNLKKHLLVYKGLPKEIYVLFAANVINKIGFFILPLTTLILTKKIGMTNSEAGLFVTIAMLSQMPFIMLGGKLIDKNGSKKTIIIFQTLGALFYIICAFLKPSIIMAILIVVASDIYGIASPSFNTIVTEITPRDSVKKAFSLIYLGYNLGFAIGPILGGLLFASHLNLLFLLDALTTLIATAFILFMVRDRKRDDIKNEKTAADAEGLAANKSCFHYLTHTPLTLLFICIFFIYDFCYIQFNFLLPMQTADIFKPSGVRLFSYLLSFNAVIVILFTPIITSFTQKMHPLRSIFIGGSLYFLSFVLYSFNHFYVLFLIATLSLTIGEILISINSNTYISHRTDPSQLGRVNSTFSIIRGGGTALGPVVMGNIVMLTNYQISWLVVAALMLSGAFFMFVVLRADKASHPA